MLMPMPSDLWPDDSAAARRRQGDLERSERLLGHWRESESRGRAELPYPLAAADEDPSVAYSPDSGARDAVGGAAAAPPAAAAFYSRACS
jgi:hypothetical protein